VAIYEYECEQHGRFEVLRPMAAAAAAVCCASCGLEARRMPSAPRVVSQRHGGWTAALDHAQKSRSEPEVVRSLPVAGDMRPARMATLTAARCGLPRP
jgi:putative FmdB family regulatory protein